MLFSLTLIGCNKSNDEYIFTLYSSYRKANRLHVATFDAIPRTFGDQETVEQLNQLFSANNFNDCKKVAELLEGDWNNTVKNEDLKYWCEKGVYRK